MGIVGVRQDRAVAALLVGIASLIGAAASSQDVSRQVSGSVRDSLGLPVAGATVMITPGGRLTRVDSTGRFTVRGLAAASLLLRVRQPGVAPRDTILDLTRATSVEVELVMRRLPRVLDTVVVTAPTQCARFTLEGVLCRRGTGAGLFLSEDEVRAKRVLSVGEVLGDVPGFRLINVRSRYNRGVMVRDVESVEGWRCIVRLVNGNAMSLTNQEPLPKDLIGVEVYQPHEAPPEYRHWIWRGRFPCTLVNYWTRQAQRRRGEP
jgi:hypothetical protein